MSIKICISIGFNYAWGFLSYIFWAFSEEKLSRLSSGTAMHPELSYCPKQSLREILIIFGRNGKHNYPEVLSVTK